MKKLLRFIFNILITIIVLYSLFIFVESARISKKGFKTKPIILLEEKVKDNYIIYKGLGYTVKYSPVDYDEDKLDLNNLDNAPHRSAEFRLFNKILLWAWIE